MTTRNAGLDMLLAMRNIAKDLNSIDTSKVNIYHIKMAASRSEILKLYKNLLQCSGRFESYNYRYVILKSTLFC